MNTNWVAQWIWNGKTEASPRNEWWCFRKSFMLSSENADSAVLNISADSRYVLYVNDVQVGRGPVRSWPFEQAYDRYEVGHLLRTGARNTIAVIVLHYGIPNFYYVKGRGGLLAQLELYDSDRLIDVYGTDSSWKTSRHLGQDARAPRMACQQAFTERIDGRLWHERWMDRDYDDSNWGFCRIVGPALTAPWEGLKPSGIPKLTEERIYPVRVESLSRVVPVKLTTVIDIRNHMVPESTEHAHLVGYTGFVATIIRVPEGRVQATLGFIFAAVNFGTCWIDGKAYNEEDFRGEKPELFLDLELEQGDHLFVMDVSGLEHGRGYHIGLDGDGPLEWLSPLAVETGKDSAFVSIGPFHTVKFVDHEPGEELDMMGEAYLQARQDMQSGTLTALMKWVRPIPLSLVSRDDVFASCIWKRECRPVTVPASLQQLVSPNGALTEIPRFDGADTEIIIDFGRELSGYIAFELTAEEGTVVDCYGYEYMRDGWRQDTHSLDNTLRYACRAGRQSYSSLVRRGLRYVMLTIRHASATAKPVKIAGISVIQSHYPVADIGRFQCSDTLLNEVWKMSVYTTKLCMEDTFVDCPAYEQTFWVGDSRNEALVSYYTLGAELLVKRCLELVPGSSRQTPLYADQLPGGLSSVIPNWTFLWVVACQEYYEQTGDAAFASRIWPHVRFTLEHYLLRMDELGLLNMRGWNFLDWAPIDQPNHGVVTHQNVFLCKALSAAGQLAIAAGQPTDGAAWANRAKELGRAINLHLWSEEKRAYVDCIHTDGRVSDIYSMQTQVTAFLCKVPELDRKEALEQLLLQPPGQFVPIGSPFMSFFYYEAMDEIGQYRWILDDIRRNYGRMLEHDATTCWEMYPGNQDNSGKSAAPTRSHCHAWSAAPAYFLGAIVLGVRRTAPGWKEAIIAPQPCGLSWARGAVPIFGGGRIDVSWRIDEENNRFHIRISAPASLRYEIRYPDGYEGSSERIEIPDCTTEYMQ